MKTIIAAITTFGLMILTPVVNAVPIESAAPDTPASGVIDYVGNYSVVHQGSSPGGSGSPADWGWFQADQDVDLFFDDNILRLVEPQVFSLLVGTTQSVLEITILEMELDLNDEDGFAGGYLTYSMGQTAGTFSFANHNYSRIFNSSSHNGNTLDIFVWGGDEANDLGIDLALSLVTVPEPGTIALLLLGLTGITLVGRRKRLVIE